MSVRSVLLTTDTTHHRHFAHAVGEKHPWSAVIVETGCATPPFETAHSFERERDDYESATLMGARRQLGEVAAVSTVDAINSASAVDAVAAARPDVIIVFGTRKLPASMISLAGACLNLHGGNPEEYRGLDTHLWAIYHNDFANLVTTLHYVDEGLDTGMRVSDEALPIARGMQLHQLRAVNTEACVRLASTALDALSGGRRPGGTPLRRAGRYYSFMPAVLKSECVRKFGRYTERL